MSASFLIQLLFIPRNPFHCFGNQPEHSKPSGLCCVSPESEAMEAVCPSFVIGISAQEDLSRGTRAQATGGAPAGCGHGMLGLADPFFVSTPGHGLPEPLNNTASALHLEDTTESTSARQTALAGEPLPTTWSQQSCSPAAAFCTEKSCDCSFGPQSQRKHNLDLASYGILTHSK